MRKIAIVAFIIFSVFLLYSAYGMRDFGKPPSEMDDRIIGAAKTVNVSMNKINYKSVSIMVDNEYKTLSVGNTTNFLVDNKVLNFSMENNDIFLRIDNRIAEIFPFDELPLNKSIWLCWKYGAVNETGANNAVTSVVFDYRGYDTLGEATVLFTAIAGIIMLFRKVEK